MSIKEKVALELHKPARRRYPRRRVTTKGILDLMEIDLVEMIPFEKINKGHRYILTAIDTFSKVADAEPVKRKTGTDVTLAFSKILKRLGTPKLVHSDKGKEWYNKDFQNLMKMNNIRHYSTFSPIKASIIERFNRSLKDLMYRRFSVEGSYKWLEMLPQLISFYNNRKHRTIGMKPNQVNRSNESRLLKTVFASQGPPTLQRYLPGDVVRVSKNKAVFSRGYHPNWSTELFKIRRVQPTRPITYLLQDTSGEPILGSFYTHELQRTDHPDVYLIEKIIGRKGDKVRVKWLGFDKPSWIDKKDLL